MPSGTARRCRSSDAAAAAAANSSRSSSRSIADGKVRYVGEPIAVVLADERRHRRGRARSRSRSISSRCRAVANCAGGVEKSKRCCSRPRHQPLDDLRGAPAAMPMRRSRMRPICGARRFSTRPPLRPHHGAARRDGRVGRRRRAGSPFRAPPRCRSSTGASWQSRSACRKTPSTWWRTTSAAVIGARGEFYPEDFLIPFAARHVGRPVKWIEDRRENLMAMNHAREAEVDVEIACSRDGTILALRGHVHRRHGRLYAHQRRGRRAQHRPVHVRALPHPATSRSTSVAVDDQQDAGRHLSRAGPLRDRLLPRAAARHGGGAISVSIGSSSAAATSSGMPRCPIRSRPSRPSNPRTSSTAATMPVDARPLP